MGVCLKAKVYVCKCWVFYFEEIFRWQPPFFNSYFQYAEACTSPSTTKKDDYRSSSYVIPE